MVILYDYKAMFMALDSGHDIALFILPTLFSFGKYFLYSAMPFALCVISAIYFSSILTSSMLVNFDFGDAECWRIRQHYIISTIMI